MIAIRVEWVKALCLGLKVHPNKIFIQKSDKGIPFLGAVIKHHRIYIGNRTKGEYLKLLYELKKKVAILNNGELLDYDYLSEMSPRINSYIGIMSHCRCYKLQQKVPAVFFKSEVLKKVRPLNIRFFKEYIY